MKVLAESVHAAMSDKVEVEGTEYDAIRRSVSDQRNAVQKKTFTKWVNHQLQKVFVTFNILEDNTVSQVLILFQRNLLSNKDYLIVHTPCGKKYYLSC